MRIVHTVCRINPRSGGVATSILNLADCLDDRGHSVNIFSTDDTYALWKRSDSLSIVNSDSRNPRDIELMIKSESEFDDIKVFHDHGQWMPINIAAYRLSKKNNIPRIVSPHGMLRPWALSHKKLKKKIAWSIYGRRIIGSASLVHVTSEAEANDLRRLGINNDIRVVPLGTDMPSLPEQQKCNIRTALFMARIHPVKGILELLAAWEKLTPAGWQLVIVGPDELNLIGSRSLPKQCTYKGPLDGLEKWQTLVNADLFILPTKTENFGLSIAEALYAGLPVITTTAAPWECIKEENFGWWIENTPEALAKSITEATETIPARLKSMGMAGHSYVKQRFSHDRYCDELLKLYSEVAQRHKS